ncbi:MAG TPA: A24 family peptidase [Abditibacteriaceae bacterium]|jgi:prepilin peptidase CpaA
MQKLFSFWTNAEAGVSATGVLVINTLLIAFLLTCAYTDTRWSKIYNKFTFPTMLLGIVLNGIFGGPQAALWALCGWGVGMAIQWVPFMLGLAKAGDVKFLAAVGALKGAWFCGFGFLYGAAAFGFIIVPWLAMRGELGGVKNNLKGYFTAAAITQQVPDAPTPTVTKKYVPWGLGLAVGFAIALAVELQLGRVFLLK